MKVGKRIIVVFLFFLLSMITIIAQEGNGQVTGPGDNTSISPNSPDEEGEYNPDVFNELRQNLEETQEQSSSTESGSMGGVNIFIRTLLVFLVLLILYLVIKFYAKRQTQQENKQEKIFNLVYSENIDKNNRVGIIKTLGHYFLVSLSSGISLLYEFTDKEDIDNIELLASKIMVTRKSFLDIFTGPGKASLSNPRAGQVDFLRGIKEKMNNLSRGNDE